MKKEVFFNHCYPASGGEKTTVTFKVTHAEKNQDPENRKWEETIFDNRSEAERFVEILIENNKLWSVRQIISIELLMHPTFLEG
jgi:hypothetical protein